MFSCHRLFSRKTCSQSVNHPFSAPLMAIVFAICFSQLQWMTLLTMLPYGSYICFFFFDIAYKLTYIAKVCACASKSFLYFYFFSKLFCNFYYFTSIHCPKLSRNANVLRVNDFFVIVTHATGRTTLRTPYNMVRSKKKNCSKPHFSH